MAEVIPVRDRLLDAAVETAAVNGLNRLSVGDVAKRAGLSRQTLYKHFSSKDDLVAQAVLREAGAIVEEVVAAADRQDGARDALEAAIATTLRLAREHPLLDRLITTEPEALLPLLVGDGGPVSGAVRTIAEQIVGRHLPELGADDVRRAADLMSRLLVSYAVSAPEDPPEVMAAFIATALTDGMATIPGGPASTTAGSPTAELR